MVDDIVFLVMSMGFEIDDEDVKTLMEDYKNELTTTHREEQRDITEELCSVEEMSKGNISLKKN